MKIYLASSCAPPEESPVVRAFREVAAMDKFGVHTIADSPDSADLVLFVDNHMNPDWRVRAMLEHPLLQRFPDKCMVYDERPDALGHLPGVYVSMPKQYFDANAQRAWSYYALKGGQPSPAKPTALYSFRGQPGQRISPAYRVRVRILKLRDDRAVIEAVKGFSFFTQLGDAAGHAAKKERYAQTLALSKFVLSPRGYATSSIRCYEVMAAGRVPVILADQWVPPEGPDWEKFALFVPERQVADIPEILREAEPMWGQMSSAALAAFNQYFAPDVNWHNLMEQFRILKESNPKVDPALVLRRTRNVARVQMVSKIWGEAAGMAKRVGIKK